MEEVEYHWVFILVSWSPYGGKILCFCFVYSGEGDLGERLYLTVGLLKWHQRLVFLLFPVHDPIAKPCQSAWLHFRVMNIFILVMNELVFLVHLNMEIIRAFIRKLSNSVVHIHCQVISGLSLDYYGTKCHGVRGTSQHSTCTWPSA